MVVQSKQLFSFDLDSLNIRGEPVRISCRFSSHLSCEVSIVPTNSNTLGIGIYYVLVVLLMALITGNLWTWWTSKIMPSVWVTSAMTGCLFALWLKYSYFSVVEETVIVIKNIGIQIKTTYRSGRKALEFVDHKSIADVILNEAITMVS
ncbi:hypothetical protein QZH41_009045 [Actinostola sp. cb2023]|nr:hypothetical protein QZH41_009045 [Actinostola sp. cb2023]